MGVWTGASGTEAYRDPTGSVGVGAAGEHPRAALWPVRPPGDSALPGVRSTYRRNAWRDRGTGDMQ